MTQLMPSATFNFRGQLKTIIYGAMVDRDAEGENREQKAVSTKHVARRTAL